MKFIFLIIFICNYCIFFAQDTINQRGFYSGIAAEGIVAEASRVWSKGYNIYSDDSKSYYSYSIGLNCLYSFGKRTSLVVGMHYHEYHWETSINSAQPITSKNIYTKKYLNFPMQVNYCILNKKVSPYLLVGVQMQHFFYERINNTSVVLGKTENSVTFKKRSELDLNWHIGAGTNINFKKSKIRIYLFNQFNFWDFDMWPVSLRLGITYYFKLSSH